MDFSFRKLYLQHMNYVDDIENTDSLFCPECGYLCEFRHFETGLNYEWCPQCEQEVFYDLADSHYRFEESFQPDFESEW